MGSIECARLGLLGLEGGILAFASSSGWAAVTLQLLRAL